MADYKLKKVIRNWEEYLFETWDIQWLLPITAPTLSWTIGVWKNYLCWDDPDDDSCRWTQLTCWTWTTLVRKEWGDPTSIDDWVAVVTNTTRDQYCSSSFTDEWLTNWCTYHYRTFANVSVWEPSCSPVVCLTPEHLAFVDFLLVWGWGWWWNWAGWCWGWWGWWWGVIYCNDYHLTAESSSIVIGWWWSAWWGNWWNSCFGSLVAYWWWWGWERFSSWQNWWSWWWGWAGWWNKSWWSPCDSRYWKSWWSAVDSQWGWGWGWYSSSWWWWSGSAWGGWWSWLCSDISWWYSWYWSWWWGGCYSWHSWGWPGWYWCWWNWQWWYSDWWSWWWCQWIFIMRYNKNRWYDISWWCKYECWDYCIHCFISNWTLTFN